MAGQPVAASRAAAPSRSLSHEAKLGIMVIMVLVFSFGFLVYHKMDLHQQRLTQASIGAQGDGAAAGQSAALPTSDGDPLAAANAGPQASPFADPFGDSPAVASEGITDTIPKAGLEAPADAAPMFAFNEPPQEATSSGSDRSDSTAATLEFSSDSGLQPAGEEGLSEGLPPENGEPPVLSADIISPTSEPAGISSQPAVDASGASAAFPASAESKDAAAPNGFDALSANSDSTDALAEFPLNSEPLLDAANSEASATGQQFELESIDIGAQVANAAALASGATPDFPLEASPGETAPGPSSIVGNSFDPPALTITDSSTADTVGDSPSTTPAGSTAAAEPMELMANEPTAASSDAQSSSIRSELENTAVPAESEPMLMAMAEPKQDGDFLGGFTSEPTIEDNVKKTPEESFPAQVSQNESGGTVSRPSGQPSRGFNAITRPSGRNAGNVMRNAAGSGADGKFSLAAFNYQNGTAASPTDDGAAHDSVVVQDGENYSKISKRVYGTTRYFSALAVFNQNRIPDPMKMRPGMIVLTPEARVLEERYPQLFLDLQPRSKEPAMFLVLEDGSPAYRVGERETLSEISKRFLGRSSRWVEIYQMNQSTVKDPNKLKPGIILALPEDATEVNVIP